MKNDNNAYLTAIKKSRGLDCAYLRAYADERLAGYCDVWVGVKASTKVQIMTQKLVEKHKY
jgi:hypothetical protein